MNNKFKDGNRYTIPQWRLYKNTKKTGELDCAKNDIKKSTQDYTYILDKAKYEFEKYGTIPYATNLVSTAFYYDNYDIAKDAAEFLSQSIEILSSKLILKQVNNILGKNEIEKEKQPTGKYNRSVKEFREKTQMFPNNPYYWIDLAFCYSAIGKNNKALKCIMTALQLNKNDRFVLRSASGFFQHNEEPDRALHILRASDRIKVDPWIIASEISISDAIGKTSRYIKAADIIIESKNFSPFATCEANSALGTIQIDSGNFKKGKQYFKQALVNPNDNSLAQAEFIRYQRKININVENFTNNIPLLYESAALISFWVNNNWREAAEKCLKWQNDIPYSSAPAVFGSYIACELLCDYEMARKITEKGLLANKEDEELLNNYAYALICLGELENAEIALKRRKNVNKNFVTATATRGLLEYRKGNVETGRALYDEAIDACKKSEVDILALAYFHLASEELRQKTSAAGKYKELAAEKMKQMEKENRKDMVAIYNALIK